MIFGVNHRVLAAESSQEKGRGEGSRVEVEITDKTAVARR